MLPTRSPLPQLPQSGLNVPPSQLQREIEALRADLSGKDAPAYVNTKAQGSEWFIFSAGFRVTADGDATFSGDIGALSGTFEVVVGGRWDNAATNPTRGVRLDTSVARPGTWQYYLDFGAAGSGLIVRLPGLEITSDGDATFSGELVAATGTFAGTVSGSIFTAPNAQFSGGISADSVFCDNGGSGVTLDGSGLTGLGATVNMGQLGSVLAGTLSTTGLGTPVVITGPRPIITGSRGGIGALESLLSALDAMGFLSDSSTA